MPVWRDRSKTDGHRTITRTANQLFGTFDVGQRRSGECLRSFAGQQSLAYRIVRLELPMFLGLSGLVGAAEGIFPGQRHFLEGFRRSDARETQHVVPLSVAEDDS